MGSVMVIGKLPGPLESKIFDLFDQAMELDGEARELFLQSLTASSMEAAAKVKQLIHKFDQQKNFFDEPMMRKFVRCLNKPGK